MDRADDPDLAEKMKAEAEGIFLWAFEGLQRLVANNFKFTESDRIRENREAVKRDNNNIFDFMESEGYIRRKADASISSKDFYEIYRMWCEENSLAPLKARSFSDAMIANAREIQSGALQQHHQLCRTAGLGIHGSGSHCTTSYKWVLRRFAVYVRTGGHSGGMAAGRVNPIAGTYVRSKRA